MASIRAWRFVPEPETRTTRRAGAAEGGGEATTGPFLAGQADAVYRDVHAAAFVWSYERISPLDTGNSTNGPTVSNDTGTPDGPHGTGA
ncbi:hypothetical protein GCM10020227_45120 [Streptomyces flavovirens]